MTENTPAPARITSGDLRRLVTRAELDTMTSADAINLARERKAAEEAESREAWPHRDGTVVPRSGLHDGQDPDEEVVTDAARARTRPTRFLAAVLRGGSDDPVARAFEVPAAIAELERRRDAPGFTDEARAEADAALGAAFPQAPPADSPPADPGILEQNGYAAIRSSMLGVCQALGGIPREAVDAALAYNAAAVRRLRVNTSDPRAAEALKAAEREARYLEAVRRMHRDLDDLEQRMAAADRIVAR